uniref:Uncharacterized protein n=1 Tax=Vombatus ursinus TaxID=29139 RepID=A0A4X2KJ12_VOMUR
MRVKEESVKAGLNLNIKKLKILATGPITSWCRGAYHSATDRNDFQRKLIVNLELFVAGVCLARNLRDIDLMAPQSGL